MDTGTGNFAGPDTEELTEARMGGRDGRGVSGGPDSTAQEARWSEQNGSIKETVCLRQLTYGLCSSSQERPRITGCEGERITKKGRVSRWLPMRRTKGIV